MISVIGMGGASSGGGSSTAYAWIQATGGNAGQYAEARIGEDVYGVGVYSPAGIALIPVPKAGTYTIGSTSYTVSEKGALVTATEETTEETTAAAS